MTQAEMGDWPYTREAEQVRQEQERDRLQQQQDIEDAWANVEHDISYAKHAMWATEDDIKLLKWALGIRG